MIEEELNEIVESAEVTQKCHLPICAVTEFQTAHTHFGSADCWCSAAGMGLVRIRKSSSGRRGKLRASSDPTYESRIQAAIQGIANGLYKSIAAAAKEQNVSLVSSCDYSLNWSRYHVRH